MSFLSPPVFILFSTESIHSSSILIVLSETILATIFSITVLCLLFRYDSRHPNYRIFIFVLLLGYKLIFPRLVYNRKLIFFHFLRQIRFVYCKSPIFQSYVLSWSVNLKHHRSYLFVYRSISILLVSRLYGLWFTCEILRRKFFTRRY